MRDTQKAFDWIIQILESRHIPYKISGGLAARAYGSDRELADIDIEVADENIVKVAEGAHGYITFGPGRYTDDNWDLMLMTLTYEGQEIDIAGTNASIFDHDAQEWYPSIGDLDANEPKEVFGRLVPVETKERLIAYKSRLGREVDLQDVEQLQKIEIETKK